MLEKIMNTFMAQMESLGIIATWIIIVASAKAIILPSARGFFLTLFRILICTPVGVLIGAIFIENGFGEYTSIGAGVMSAILFENSSLILKRKGEKFALYMDMAIKNLINKWTK